MARETEEDAMAQFMIMMHENDGAWDGTPIDEQKRLFKLYLDWAKELQSRDMMRGGDALARGGRMLRVVNGDVVDGPFTETKEVLTGYFQIEAPDMETAAQVARGCPGLLHGETVIVRQITDHSELK